MQRSEILKANIEAYEAQRADLETNHQSKWVVFHNTQLSGVYNDFDAAADAAVEQYGDDVFLIRQVGAPPVTLPASVMYRIA
ncbi:MAG: hypothetical protein ACRD22_05385 [Terriglobia bacterium]